MEGNTPMNIEMKTDILAGRTALVTGASRGNGAAIAKGLARHGATVAVTDVLDEGAAAVAGEIESAGGKAISRHLNVVEPDDCATVLAEVAEELGDISILINNAGVNDGVALDQDPEAFIASLEKNLIHPFALAHYLLSDLRNNRGNIINIGSKVADTGQGGTSGYAASKGAINSLTREWAIDLARFGVRVNCVIPAEVMTPLYKKWLEKNPDPAKAEARIKSTIPLENRFTRASEIADLVVFLASARSSHTTGQVMYPDGGYTHLDRAYTTPPQ